MNIQVNTDQIKVLEDFFYELSNADQRKIFIAGFRKAAKPLVNAARNNAPFNTGNLRRSIGTIEMPQEIAILVGAKKGGSYKGWHGHLVENGTVMRFRKNGGSTGKVVGKHFFENAYNLVEGVMYDRIEDEWFNAIDQYIVKVNKKIKS